MMNLQKNARMLELDIAICTYGADGPSSRDDVAPS